MLFFRRTPLPTLLLLSAFFLSGCGVFVPSDDYKRGEPSSGKDRTTTATNNNRNTGNSTASVIALRQRIVDEAENLTGTKYRYGGVDPASGMDCSGMLNYVFQNEGIMLRRSSREQVKDGVDIKKKEVKPGDLVFFSNAGQVFHVALIAEYNGSDRMYVIHSTSSKGVIRQEILQNSYWGPKISSFRNVISW
jgi:cell wall-associated NlpC family hydrolase